jgi:hypothetical protein
MRTALYLFAIVASIGTAVVFLPLPDQAVSKTVCGIVDGLILGVTVWPYHSVLGACLSIRRILLVREGRVRFCLGHEQDIPPVEDR